MDALPGVSIPAAVPGRESLGNRPATVGATRSGPVSPPTEIRVQQPSDTADQAPSEKHITQAVKQLNEAFLQKGQSLYASFEKDKITGMDIVKIVDKQSKEVIRQLPPKAAVAFAQSLELPKGWQGQLLQVTL